MMDYPGHRLVECLYESDRSVVQRMVGVADENPVVLKVLRAATSAPEQVAQFKREYAIATRFNHRAILRPTIISRNDGHWLMVAPDTRSKSLDKYLAERRAAGKDGVEIDVFFDIALALCDILETIHAGSVIHNDINPSNLLWNETTKKIHLIDFGIASELSRESPGIQSPHVLEGSLEYMAPERTGRMNRLVDYRADFYSLGATLYALLSGRPPFEAQDAMELVHCHIARSPDWSRPVFRALPPVMVGMLQRLLGKNAEDRYQVIQGLRRDLKLCQTIVNSTQVTLVPHNLSDMSGIFHIPQKLYGREKEIQSLLAAFDRASAGACELLLVAGYSGIGKSAVVNEVHKPIVEKRGYFVSGKFDQYTRNIPYSSLVQAFRDVIRQILTEPRDIVAKWSDKLMHALGPQAGVIANLIPDLRWIIGATEPVPELPPLDAQNRLNRLFQKFVQVFASAEHPLVVFLDDLQWADPPSLQLIDLFMSDRDDRHMLFIGAYRDNEVGAGHPLLALLDKLQKRGSKVETLTLPPLREEHVNALLVDTLLEPSEACAPLAELCCSKTSGNPFFLNQFLRAVHDSGYISYDYDTSKWCWDVSAIENASFTDNVVDLMIGKIERLPESTQKLLQLAASVGNRFDLGTLVIVLEQPGYVTQRQLWPAMEAELIRPVDNRYKYLSEEEPSFKVDYRFLHDRVQQAAYALATEEEKKQHHLKIGRLLLGGSSDFETNLFTIVEHLNAGKSLITEPDERLQLARLDYRAGMKARGSAAHHAAARYMQIGISLLPEDAWTNAYHLMLDLHLGAAETAYLSGDFATAERMYPGILDHCATVLDKVRCYTVQVSQYQLQGRFLEGIEIQRAGLHLLGVDIPKLEADQLQMMMAGFEEIEKLCENRAMGEIKAAPEMQNAEHISAMQLLFVMWYASYLAGLPILNAVITIVMTRLSLLHGTCDITPFAYVNYGAIAAMIRGKHAFGYEFGSMGVELSSLRKPLTIRGSAHFLFATFTNHWNRHLSTCNQYYDDAYAWSVESGDYGTAGYILAVRSTDRIIQGKYLPDLLEAFERDIIFPKKTGQVDMVDCITVGAIQTVKNLMGKTDRFDTYDDGSFNEAKFVAEYADKPLHLAYFYHGKIRNAYLFDTPQAEAMAGQLPLVEIAIPGQCKIPEATFYAAMIWLRALRRSPERSDARAVLEKLAKVEERLQLWASLCPDNFEAKYLLVLAEGARMRGEFAEATELYRRATASARAAKYVNLEAVANELHGEFWLEHKQDRIGEVFLADAAHLYRSWGAHGKLAHLQQRHGALLATASQRLKPEMASGPLSVPLSDPRSIGSLDVASILDANHALSSEIGLGRVLTRLIKILRENSGAQTVKLLLQNDTGWCIEGSASGDETEVLQSRPVGIDDADSRFFPLSLVRYVLRTGEEIVEQNLSNSVAYAGDPYCLANRPKSVMCLPIKRFSQVAGVIYLENNLAADVFTRERARFVRMLGVQAIISIDNARLYQSLEYKVEERTRELHAKNDVLVSTQRQLVAQEKLASLGVLTAGIAHELKNPLNFVNNFADLSVGLVDELNDSMASYRDEMDPEADEELRETLQMLRANVEKIRDHGKRASQIIDGMLMHSRESRGNRELTDLRKLIMNAVALTKEGIRNRPVRLDVAIDVDCAERLEPVEIVSSDISRVLINVIGNALDALQQKKQSAGPAFEPRITVRVNDRDDHVEIRIRDNGTGIPQNILQDIWTPFFTTKPTGSGTGLGLSISYDIIVGAHRGTMHVESTAGEFAEFIVTIPRDPMPHSLSE